MIRATIAFVAAAFATTLAIHPAIAGDGAGLKLPGKPGLLYTFNERSRRGVTIADKASLILRFDGCWTGSTALHNTSGHPRTVSVTVQFLDEAGRPIASVPVVRGERLDGLASATIERANCAPALAASYALQRCWTVRRLVSAW